MADPKQISLFDDYVTLTLYGVLGFASIVLLTPVGLITMLVPLAIMRLTHRPTWVLSTLVVGSGVIIGTTLSGALSAALADLGRLLIAVFAPAAKLTELLAQWLSSIYSPETWLAVGPIGLALGSSWSLITHQQNQSPLVALMEGRTPESPTRAPLAGWFHRLVEARSARRGKSIVIGSEWQTGATVRVTDTDLNTHTLVIGTTGAGKSTALLNLIEASAGMGMVIVDGKGDADLARRVIGKARAQGQTAYLFDATGSGPSDVYNPLAYGDFTSLTDRIMTMRIWSEPHYRTLAEGFAQTAFKVMQACKQPVDLLTAAEAMDSKFLLNTLRRTSKGGPKFTVLANEVTAQRGAEPHVEGLRADLRNLSGSIFAPLFDTKRARAERAAIIRLQRARKEGAVVYFCLPKLLYPDQAAKLGRLIVNDIKAAASSSDTPWRIILDEFSTFAGPQVLNLINMGRSHGLAAVLATQSLADISQGAERDGRSFTDQLIGSINTFLVYRLNASSDCELMAGVAGTHEQVEFTAQTVAGMATGGASARHTRQYKVHPDAFKNLNVGEAILINKNAPSSVRYGMFKARRPST